MLRVILLQKAYNPGYTYLRNGKIVRVEAFSDRRVKRATAASKRDGRTGDLFGDAGPTIDKPLKELIEDHEKIIGALESPSKAKRQAAADEQKAHLDEYREQLDTAAKVRLIEGSMDAFGGYELGVRRYTGEDAEMLVDEAREIAFATGKRIEDALLQIVPAEQLKADEPITGTRAVAQRQVNAVNRFIESATEQFGLSKEEAGRAWDYYVANKLVRADPVAGQYQLKDGRFWDGEVLRRAAGEQEAPVPEGHPAPIPRSLLSAIPEDRREEWKGLHREQHELHHYELGQVREKMGRVRSKRNKALSAMRSAEAGLASLRAAPIADPGREAAAMKEVDRAQAEYSRVSRELDGLVGTHQALFERVAKLGRAKERIYPDSGDLDRDFASMQKRSAEDQVRHEKDMLRLYRQHYKSLDAARKGAPLTKSFPRVRSVRQVVRMS